MADRLSLVTHLGAATPAVKTALAQAAQDRVVSRLWARDHTLWKSTPTEISNRLGWLTLAESSSLDLTPIDELRLALRRGRYRDVVLLGMGGSSLGPEVLRLTFGSAKGAPRLWVLDTTVPSTIDAVTRAISPAHTLFIVASKSGGTIEVMSLLAHFEAVLRRTKGTRGGAQFIAITDPGTSLADLARSKGFGHVFQNPADIGGRYSVLSYFGLVPAGLIGIDITRLIERAVAMGKACREERRLDKNPGAFLGLILGALARTGRDKVTILTSPRIDSFGIWAEQLLAESTGKDGRGLVPVANEPAIAPDEYGTDRVFVSLRLKGDKNAALDRRTTALRKAGHPVVELALRDRYDLGAEFFRWEFATAVAGQVLGIHPFDQPNVQESKDNTGRLLKELKATGQLPAIEAVPPRQALRQLLAQATPGAYVGILAYMQPSRQSDAAIRELRRAILSQARLATTAGYGPRYLHSTGQVHKGGPPTGLFLHLLEAGKPKLAIPGQDYTFGTLAHAQAIGDLQSLRSHGRPVVHVRLGSKPLATLGILAGTSRRQTGSRAPRARATSTRPAPRRAARRRAG